MRKLQSPIRSDWKFVYGPHCYSILMVIVTIVFGLMPVWANWLFLNNFQQTFATEGQRVTLKSFIRGGDFALFSASLLGPCIFLAFRGSGATLRKTIRGAAPFLCLMFAVFLYAGITVWKASLGKSDVFQLNYDFLETSSKVLFISATFIFFGTTLREAKANPEGYKDMLTDPAVMSDTEKVSNDLGDKVDK